MINNSDKEVISIFKETNALLTGHFILRSGLRSGHFFQCAQVCQYLDKVTRLAQLLIENLGLPTPNLVVSPAMGGSSYRPRSRKTIGLPIRVSRKNRRSFGIKKEFLSDFFR